MCTFGLRVLCQRLSPVSAGCRSASILVEPPSCVVFHPTSLRLCSPRSGWIRADLSREFAMVGRHPQSNQLSALLACFYVKAHDDALAVEVSPLRAEKKRTPHTRSKPGVALRGTIIALPFARWCRDGRSVLCRAFRSVCRRAVPLKRSPVSHGKRVRGAWILSAPRGVRSVACDA